MGKINTLVKEVKKKAKPRKKPSASRDPLARRYSRLVRSLAQKDTKVVISMGSGGIRMFAHLSVLRFLENLGVSRHISELWGSSGGAIIGMLFGMGLKADEILFKTDVFFQKHQVKLYPSVFTVAKNILKDVFVSSNGATPMRGFHSIHEALQEFVEGSHVGGKEKYPWYCLAYNLEKNRTDVLTSCDIPEGGYPDFIYRTDPLDAIIASSSVPVLFHPKVINDAKGKRTYTDGGAGEEIPTVSIYKKWLQDREMGLEKRRRLLVIAVDLGTDLSSGGFFERWLMRRIPAFQYLRMTVHLTDLVRRARIADQKRILMRDPNIELWEINLNLAHIGFLDLNSIPSVITLAEKIVPEQFAKLNDSLLT